MSRERRLTSRYPEHERLKLVQEDSNTIGQFLDHGLPDQSLMIYERFEEPCGCHQCRVHETADSKGVHSEADRIENGVAIDVHYRPTHKSIEEILADYFDIDLKKIADEKQEMYDRLVAKS